MAENIYAMRGGSTIAKCTNALAQTLMSMDLPQYEAAMHASNIVDALVVGAEYPASPQAMAVGNEEIAAIIRWFKSEGFDLPVQAMGVAVARKIGQIGLPKTRELLIKAFGSLLSELRLRREPEL